FLQAAYRRGSRPTRPRRSIRTRRRAAPHHRTMPARTSSSRCRTARRSGRCSMVARRWEPRHASGASAVPAAAHRTTPTPAGIAWTPTPATRSQHQQPAFEPPLFQLGADVRLLDLVFAGDPDLIHDVV